MDAAGGADQQRCSWPDGRSQTEGDFGRARDLVIAAITAGDFILRGLVTELGRRGLKVDYRSAWEFVHAEKLSKKAWWLANAIVPTWRGGAPAQMRGDPLASGKYLDGTAGEPDLDLVAGEAMRYAVIMLVDIDVIIDSDTAGALFGEHVGLGWQWPERGPVGLRAVGAVSRRDAEPGVRRSPRQIT